MSVLVTFQQPQHKQHLANEFWVAQGEQTSLACGMATLIGMLLMSFLLLERSL
ncbi:hypothetical protein [Scytonema sp. HK-05]|uniref:hypothetical protein n=1 Tax=Scytonema sp. HK-05 TaxID=1137095 RepID=UPI001300FDAB|nr:hypothetical protein [Scytonema sp. HK-05]